MVHIGQLIKSVFDSKGKSCTIEWFASQLNCKRANIYNIFNRPTIDSQLLEQISIILGHDFFKDLSNNMRVTRPEKSPASTEHDAKRELYDNMMSGISRSVYREIRRLSLTRQIADVARLNHLDDENSMLPPSQFAVFVMGKEDPDVKPHMHLRSIADRYELRIGLDNSKMLSVKRRGASDYKEASNAAFQWLGLPSAIDPALTNRDMALALYTSLNTPRKA
ncbi:hypothetical protein [uncultured Duncaniella sp.]|uniref:hypothetical protein n=4 Tax=uncultured Duncaniella sp. TaxID=2768039 RepID=UPI00262C35F9|nr:hypothetical protein [uncultured Duncaniella sp.]